MTDKPTPTDAELKAMWQLHAADIGGIFCYARAVLAKWGTPQPAPATQQAGATKEHVHLVRVIADKIEDGTLFRSGIYSNKDLARFVRNVADAAAPQFPTTRAQADSVQEDAAREPLQIFDSPRAKAMMRAFEEGWAACRDAEFVGEDAQNDAFNQSATVNVCMAEDWTAAVERASHWQASSQAGEYPALVCDYCGALTPDPWHSSGMLHGKMSKHIHSCDACAARGAAQAQDTREPLTPERVKEIVRGAGYDQCGIPDTERAAFINGLRHGEQAHGIKVGQHGEAKP